MASELFVGLMAGTSADGVDAVVADFGGPAPRVAGWYYQPYPAELKQAILAAAAARDDDLDQICALDRRLGVHFAEAVLQLLAASGVEADQIVAVGSHGQTLRHRPPPGPGYTYQAGDPNLIAAQTGITTVADFRRRDMAEGGQGAPLAPAFHQQLFADPHEPRAVLNVGGMANLSLLTPDAPVVGFDTGPGNVLMDAWSRLQGQGDFDRDGAWAASGQANERLLGLLLEHPFFGHPPPKSCGHETFNLPWLRARLERLDPLPSADVQATLCALTAASIAAALRQHMPACRRLLVCGGGAYNGALMDMLGRRWDGGPVQSSGAYGVEPDRVEALAFAWLARRTLLGLTGNLPEVTGARQAVVLGGIYPGSSGRP